MDISSVSSSLIQQISNTSTETGDAVTIKVMRKALDIQEQQAMQLIESAAQSSPAKAQKIDVFA